MLITSRRKILSVGSALATAPWLTMAQSSWPVKPIRVVSAGSPGGTSDILVRIIENQLRDRLGQPLFIDNKPGAGGMTAAGIVASAPADGHTLFISNLATNAIGLSLYKKPSFNPQSELPPVARIATMSNAIAVRTDSGINNLKELIAALKIGIGKPFYGSAGIGTSSHLTGHMLGKAMDVELNHVPYKGTAANLNALLAGEVLFSADNFPLYVQHIKSGAIRVLGVTQAKRMQSHPDIPTVKEATGWTNFDIFTWFGLSASTGTSELILKRVSEELVSILTEPLIIEKIRAIGAEPAALNYIAYKNFINEEILKWRAIVAASGATAD